MVEACGEGMGQPPGLCINVSVVSPQADDVDLVAVGVVSAQGRVPLRGGLAALDRLLGGAIERMRTGSGLGARVGETVRIDSPAGVVARRVLLVGLGTAADLDAAALKNAGRLAVECALDLDIRTVGFSAGIHDAGIKSFSADRIAEAVAQGAREGFATRDQGGVRRLTFHLDTSRARRKQAILGARQ
jgi:hypothetical protein